MIWWAITFGAFVTSLGEIEPGLLPFGQFNRLEELDLVELVVAIAGI